MLLPRLGSAADAPFPPVERARRDPNGLLAWDGDLSPERLLAAYRQGIFPWYSPGQPILWWSPDPRMVFRTDAVHLSSRFRRTLRGSPWRVSADSAFAKVLDACAETPRHGESGTWITPEMREAYLTLHRLGHAHSIEVHDGAHLVGGLYGVTIGRMFFGESMVSLASGGSKVALAGLARRLRDWGWPLIDAQVESAHLVRMGGLTLPRARFSDEVARLTALPGRVGDWREMFGEFGADLLATG